MLSVLIIGVLLAWQMGHIETAFHLQACISIGLPLYIVTMISQNLPGIAVLKAHKYKAPISASLNFTGFVNMLTALFGANSINLAAITAAICMSDEVDKNHDKRYWASIAGGVFYILMASCAATFFGMVASLPQPLIYLWQALRYLALLLIVCSKP